MLWQLCAKLNKLSERVNFILGARNPETLIQLLPSCRSVSSLSNPRSSMAGGKIRKENYKTSSRKIRKENYKTSSSQVQGGITLLKSRGQHILKSRTIVESIVNKAGIKSTDVILEIGPGTGNLTKNLLEAGKSVIAVELDERMVSELQRKFQDTICSNRLKIIQGDFLKCDLPYFDICVANIPYQISSPLVTKLLKHKEIHKAGFRCAIIMFQKEFATRLLAQKGDRDYCRLSVNTQLRARVSHLLRVGKNNFVPPPKVDSSVVRIEPRTDIKLNPQQLQEMDGLLRICFNRKNKTLGSIFSQKKLLALLEKNYKTMQSFGVSSSMDLDGLDDDDDDDDNDDDDDKMDIDSGFKSKVLGVLKKKDEKMEDEEEKYDYTNKRSTKLVEADFIHLLGIFNEAGIHFR